MGHSRDDAVNKIPYKMKTHWQNQLKISILVNIRFSIELYTKIDVINTCPMLLKCSHSVSVQVSGTCTLTV